MSDKQIIKALERERDHALENAAFWRAAFNRWCGKATWPLNKKGFVEYEGVEFHPPKDPMLTKSKDGTMVEIIPSDAPRVRYLKPVAPRGARITAVEDDDREVTKDQADALAAEGDSPKGWDKIEADDAPPKTGADAIRELRNGLGNK